MSYLKGSEISSYCSLKKLHDCQEHQKKKPLQPSTFTPDRLLTFDSFVSTSRVSEEEPVQPSNFTKDRPLTFNPISK